MLVRMADVEAAIQEMFQAPHIQVSPKGTPCVVISTVILVSGTYLVDNEILTR